MTTQITARARIKTKTLYAGDRMDSALSAFDITRPDGLAGFLRAHALGLDTCARALRNFGPPAWMRTTRRQRDAARFDLSAITHLDKDAATALPSILLEPRSTRHRSLAALGIAYVVATILHGTSALNTHWQRHADRDAFPDGFTPLAFAGTEWKASWNNIMSLLHETLMSDADLLVVIEAANRTFNVFETCAIRSRDSLLARPG